MNYEICVLIVPLGLCAVPNYRNPQSTVKTTCYDKSHDETKLLSTACDFQTHQTASIGTKNFKLRDLGLSQISGSSQVSKHSSSHSFHGNAPQSFQTSDTTYPATPEDTHFNWYISIKMRFLKSSSVNVNVEGVKALKVHTKE